MSTKVVFIFSRFKPDRKGTNGYLAMQDKTCSYADLSLEEEAGTFSSQMTVEGEYHNRAPAPLSHSLSTLWWLYLIRKEGPDPPPLFFPYSRVQYTLQRTVTENFKQIFPEKELHGHRPNFHIHVSVREIYIFPPSICLFCCRKYVDRSWE